MSASQREPSAFDFVVIQAALRKLMQFEPGADPKTRARQLVQDMCPDNAMSDEMLDALVLGTSPNGLRRVSSLE
jgi:hypothetical protein